MLLSTSSFEKLKPNGERSPFIYAMVFWRPFCWAHTKSDLKLGLLLLILSRIELSNFSYTRGTEQNSVGLTTLITSLRFVYKVYGFAKVTTTGRRLTNVLVKSTICA